MMLMTELSTKGGGRANIYGEVWSVAVVKVSLSLSLSLSLQILKRVEQGCDNCQRSTNAVRSPPRGSSSRHNVQTSITKLSSRSKEILRDSVIAGNYDNEHSWYNI